MSQKDRDRLVLLHQVRDSLLTVSEGARRARLGVRQFRRLLRRFERAGDAAVVHGARGRRPNNSKPAELREVALARAHDPLYADFGPTLLSEHLARDGVEVHPHTLRRWMIEDGCWPVRRQGKRHRRRRQRRNAFGELVLMDTSIHNWLEGRSPEPMVLIASIDDATGRLFCRFFPADTGAANRHHIVTYLELFGRPGAFYTDRAGHFQNHYRATARRERDEEEALSLIRRGLDRLGIELILALSPQAKGRVERLFKTLQDRLIKEMRIAGIASPEEANRFLQDHFIPFYNQRFTVPAADPTDAHRPLADRTDLLSIFAETAQRVIRADFTFRFRTQHYQIERNEADGAMPGSRITIESRLDGSRRFRWHEHDLDATPVAAPATPPPPPKPLPDPARPLRGAAGRPTPPDHPWRRHPILVGRGRPLSPLG